MERAKHHLQAGSVGRLDDRVELGPVVDTRRRLDQGPLELVCKPGEAGLPDQPDGVILDVLAVVPEVSIEAVAPGARHGRAAAGLLSGEGVRQVTVRQVSRPCDREGLARVVLLVVPAGLRLLIEVGRQVLAGEDRLEIVGQQQPLRALAAGVVVHDAPLEALIDEVGIRRVGRRLARGRAPDLEVQARQDVLLAVLVGKGVGTGNRVREGLVEVDRLAAEGIRRLLLGEGDDGGGVVGVADLGRSTNDRGVRRWEHAAVDGDIGHQTGVEQVERLHPAVRLELHDVALEDLDLEAVQPELTRYRVAEGAHAAALLEEGPEGVIVDAKVRLRKEPRVSLLLSRGGGRSRRKHAGQQAHDEHHRHRATGQTVHVHLRRIGRRCHRAYPPTAMSGPGGEPRCACESSGLTGLRRGGLARGRVVAERARRIAM
jgi:hypothetical protein